MPTVLVTGASRGIGKAIAVALAEAGYDVAITARTVKPGDAAPSSDREDPGEAPPPGSLEETAAVITAAGRRAVPIPLDLLDRDALVPAAHQAIEALGHIDVLVNNAIYVGPESRRRFLDTPAEQLERRVFANVTAQLLLTQPVLAHMVERGAGVIANVTSAVAKLPPTAPVGEGGWALGYAVSKGGFHRMASMLDIEYGPAGITAYNLQPGYVATERARSSPALSDIAERGVPPEVIGTTVARVLSAPAGTYRSGRTIEVQDVARELGVLRAGS